MYGCKVTLVHIAGIKSNGLRWAEPKDDFIPLCPPAVKVLVFKSSWTPNPVPRAVETPVKATGFDWF